MIHYSTMKHSIKLLEKLTPEEKNTISHRGNALKNLERY